MLEKIEIVDFQRHERLRISLDPLITTVIGPSDCGKSAAVRALRWLATNRPQGAEFVRHGAPAARVRLAVDGRRVERRRGKSGNAYKLDGRELVAFGSDVPADVAGLLNVDEVNFQGQHDAPFWFSLTPGEVARQINAIVDLGAIDVAQGRVAARLRQAKAERDVVERRLAEAREEVDGLAYVDELRDDLADVESMFEAAAEAQGKATALSDVLGRISDAVTEHLRLATFADAAAAAVALGDAARRAGDDAGRLSLLLSSIADARGAAAERPPDVDEMESWRSTAGAARVAADGLRALLREIADAQRCVAVEEQSVEAAETALAEAGEVVCPTCGRPMEVDSCG